MTPQDLVGLALVYAIIASSLAVALVMERRGTGGDARKVVHVGVGFFVLVWWMFSENWIMLVFFTVPFAVLLFIAMFRGNAVSESKLGDLANNKGHRTGLFLYAVTITILVAFFWDHWTAATIGVVAMTFGDGFGSIVGRSTSHPLSFSSLAHSKPSPAYSIFHPSAAGMNDTAISPHEAIMG